MTGRLAGKVALITGTGGGQGRAAAMRFAAEGATVVGCDVDAGAHAETAAALRGAGFTLYGAAPVDLGDPAQASDWVNSAATAHGRIDVLYNNASSARFGPIEEFSVDDWRYTVRNELDLVFFTTHYGWPHLRRSRGVIINVASTAAWAGSRGVGKAAHSATKAGILGFTRQVAAEGAPHGIRAVSISPGFIVTPGTAAFANDPTRRAALLAGIPLGRPGEPADVVGLAVYLASDEASFVTGADFIIDGGQLAV